MAHQVFVSYASPDGAAAQAICRALEEAGIRCWIAPRDISPGSQWGGSIVQAIKASKAVVVVFSERSNASPQVTREMECAVAERLPLVPVRIADAMPTEDMQYFLGVSHWFNAFPDPLAAYLPEIVAATKRVLAGESAPWRKFRQRLPPIRARQLSIVAVAIVVAAAVAYMMRPAPAPDYRAALISPMAGRWQAKLKDAQGNEALCVFDVPEIGPSTFSNTCPFDLAGNLISVQAKKDGGYAPQLFQAGQDTGSFHIYGGRILGMDGAFRLDGRSRMVTRDAQHGEIAWDRIKSDGPLPNDMDGILPREPDWPLKDVAAIAARARAYVQMKWARDAVLMAVELDQQSYDVNLQTAAGPLSAVFEFYSQGKQQRLAFRPNAGLNTYGDMGAGIDNPQRALPAQFVDLPDAVANLRSRGLRGQQIAKARIENWGQNAVYHGVRVSGPYWVIETAIGEQGGVPAATR